MAWRTPYQSWSAACAASSTEMDQTGCLGFMDPWSFVACAAHIEHALAREILIKQVPMILRAQEADGGWGEHAYKVFAALRRHGLLDELRAKPPLPPDWHVVRSIPVPKGDLWGLVWDGARLWTGVRATNEAIAFAPADGRIVKRVRLPEGHGRWLGWWNGKLAVTQGSPKKHDPKRLLQIDPDHGRILHEVALDELEHVGGVVQLGDKLWVFDAFFGSEYVLDAAEPLSPTETRDEGALPVALAVTANAAGTDAMWCVDAWSPWVIKTNVRHRLLDWAERPFRSFNGVAWDGARLWALYKEHHRLCVIEKSATAPWPSASIAQD